MSDSYKRIVAAMYPTLFNAGEGKTREECVAEASRILFDFAAEGRAEGAKDMAERAVELYRWQPAIDHDFALKMLLAQTKAAP